MHKMPYPVQHPVRLSSPGGSECVTPNGDNEGFNERRVYRKRGVDHL
jgi:hypothetical protein